MCGVDKVIDLKDSSTLWLTSDKWLGATGILRQCRPSVCLGTLTRGPAQRPSLSVCWGLPAQGFPHPQASRLGPLLFPLASFSNLIP